MGWQKRGQKGVRPEWPLDKMYISQPKAFTTRQKNHRPVSAFVSPRALRFARGLVLRGNWQAGLQRGVVELHNFLGNSDLSKPYPSATRVSPAHCIIIWFFWWLSHNWRRNLRCPLPAAPQSNDIVISCRNLIATLSRLWSSAKALHVFRIGRQISQTASAPHPRFFQDRQRPIVKRLPRSGPGQIPHISVFQRKFIYVIKGAWRYACCWTLFSLLVE